MARTTLSKKQLRESHRCKVYRSTSFNTASGSGTDVTWDAEEYDTLGMHTANARNITILKDGLYAIACQLIWATHTTGDREVNVFITRGGVNACIARTNINAKAAGIDAGHVAYVEKELLEGDVVWVQVYQNSGATVHLLASNAAIPTTYSWLSVREVK